MSERTIDLRYHGMSWELTGDWYPGEKPVMNYGDGTGDPGSAPTFNIKEVFLSESENLVDILSPIFMDRLTSVAIDALTDEDDERRRNRHV